MSNSFSRAVVCRTLTLLGLLLLALPWSFAQETTAGIQGSVKDQQGAVVKNATVEVSGPALIGTRKVRTDDAGAYRIAQLPPGVYSLVISAPGFRTVRRENITLEAGRLPSIDIALEVGTVAETIEVTSEAPLVDLTQSKVAVSVSETMLNNIPKGRSFQSVIPFAPGARQEPLQSTTSSRTGGFQIDGASDSENVYLQDGINTTNIQNGGVGKNFQTDFIQEVQIKSSSFEAEFGGALGGVINAVPKRGSNNWHGELKSYFQSAALDANDPCASGYTSGGVGTFAGFSTVCGLRLNPSTSLNTAVPVDASGAVSSCVAAGNCRLDGTPEYYVPKKDGRYTIEPGYELGGPLLTNKLWLFSSYIPTIDTINRTTTFTGANPGPRTLTQSYIQHNAYNRLEYGMFNSLRLFGSWNYAYSRSKGTLGNPDSAYGQVNTGATTDPNTLRSDNGSVNPSSVYAFGGDWTPTSKLVVSARYGYFFNNNEQRGKPIGTRYVYNQTVNANTSKDITGATFPSTFFTSANGCAANSSGVQVCGSGFANMPSNLTTLFDAYKRKSLNADASYFINKFGSHTFKWGYFRATQSNEVLSNFNTSNTSIDWANSYSPVTSTSACDAVKADNVARGWPGVCQGRYGFFTVGTGVVNTGIDRQTAQAVYLQDGWTVGHGLTLNLGIRLDQETQPPYDPKRFPTVEFDWSQKIAPRIGGAYDLLHNGKLKVYASYGQFYDIMKMGLARGSFGSDYWHNCVYALDDLNYNLITPTLNFGGGCPASGPAPGVTVGRFIENVDFRATKADPRDPAIDPSTLKPMKQHEFVTGADWAISNTWLLESRYSRKRLDNTIEDMAITDNLGFYIGNPGTPFADLLHRQFVVDPAVGLVGPLCSECPPVVPAIRRYDGVEFRLTRRSASRWGGSVSYLYSKLTGNYAGLTNSDPTDGAGGRHSPNNNRAFDIPTMTYLPSGQIDDGPLSTDRPHTVKGYGYYILNWFGMTTNLGLFETAFQGTPIGTCLPVVGTSSACQWAAGRGNFVPLTRQADGTIVAGAVENDKRTSPFLQTDLSISHEIRVSKTHESYRLVLEGNAFNILNNRSALAYNEIVTGSSSQLINPVRIANNALAPRFPGDPGTDWAKVMNGYNFVNALNGTGAFAGTYVDAKGKPQFVQTPVTLASRYGLPQVFQQARQFRLALKFRF